MITTNETVTGKVYVWAIPRSKYEMDNDKTGSNRPFRYELSTSSYSYTPGAVKVHEAEVPVVVPAGINLVAKAIETLEDEKVKARDEYLKKVQEYQKQIDQLKLLPPPEPKKEVAVAEGEFIPAGDIDDDIPF